MRLPLHHASILHAGLTLGGKQGTSLWSGARHYYPLSQRTECPNPITFRLLKVLTEKSSTSPTPFISSGFLLSERIQFFPLNTPTNPISNYDGPLSSSPLSWSLFLGLPHSLPFLAFLSLNNSYSTGLIFSFVHV